MEDLRTLQAEHHKRLVRRKNVVGTGLGHKHTEGKPTGEPALIIFVEKKLPDDTISKSSFLPTSLDGVPVDVIEVGKLVKQDVLTGRVRPIKPGYSCGNGRITAGTIGGIFRDRDGDAVVLSNNHVLAAENQGQPGDPIFQPGPYDAPGLDQTWRGWPEPIANLPYFAILKDYVKLQTANNNQDSAIAVIPTQAVNDGIVDQIYPFVNRTIAGWGMAQLNQSVQKIGRTTGHTAGRVLALNGQFSIDYDFGTGGFLDCIVLTSMSAGGDSGSIIFDMDMNAVALLFAGSDKVTLANPIATVRDHYGLQLWSQPVNAVPADLSSSGWSVYGSGVTISGTSATITAKANQAAGIEHVAPTTINSVSCTIYTGTDGGATWGPGIAIQFPHEVLKVNLRSGGTFGAYFNTTEYLGTGRSKPNTWYNVRIRFTTNTVVLEADEVDDSPIWSKLIELPRSLVPHPPVAIRVGKMDGMGGKNNHTDLGTDGQCIIKDVLVS